MKSITEEVDDETGVKSRVRFTLFSFQDQRMETGSHDTWRWTRIQVKRDSSFGSICIWRNKTSIAAIAVCDVKIFLVS